MFVEFRKWFLTRRPPPLPQTSPFLERYTVRATEPPLGSGGFGFCVRCRTHGPTGELYAAKVLLRFDPTVFNELQMLRKCQGHANVVRLVDNMRDRQFAYIITECLTGGDLRQQAVPVKTADGRLPVEPIVRQLVAGVRHIHQRGVAHRDLKPRNIMFAGDGSQRLCLIDFGLAARIANPVAMRGGGYTLDYASPEMLDGGRPVTEACDFWSLGATLYHWLCEHRPFGERGGEHTVSMNIMRGHFDGEHRRWLELPALWRRLIRGLLNVNVVARRAGLAALADVVGP